MVPRLNLHHYSEAIFYFSSGFHKNSKQCQYYAEKKKNIFYSVLSLYMKVAAFYIYVLYIVLFKSLNFDQNGETVTL